MRSITIIFAFLSCLCKQVNARTYLGGYIGGSIGGLIVLILDIIAIVDVLRSPRPILEKFLWILLIILFPLVGLLIWLFCGRKSSSVV